MLSAQAICNNCAKTESLHSVQSMARIPGTDDMQLYTAESIADTTLHTKLYLKHAHFLLQVSLDMVVSESR